MKIERIQKLNKQTLDEITDLHFKVLSESFINNFGREFVKISYIAILKNLKNIFFIATENGKFVGYLVATPNGEEFNKKVFLQSFWKLSWELLKSFTRNPFLILYLAHWFFLSLKRNDINPEIKYIAVNPKYQGKGVGTKLVNRLNIEFRKSSINQYKVGTKANSIGSNNFYQKLGFSYYDTKTFFGDKFNFYSYKKFIHRDVSFVDQLPKFILIFFLALYIFKSLVTIVNVPFYDFDEAHRAENAKRMREYKSFFVPLTGSGFDRIERLNIPIKDDPVEHLYYHLERPFLVYLAMIGSISIFGQSEWAYRLPSFIFGLLTLLATLIFISRFTSKRSAPGFIIAILSLITSSDLWLSSQYAQMDTGITLFIFLSLLSLISFCQYKQDRFIYLTGLLFALSILSKGQPSIIFLFPLIYLLIIKRLVFKDLAKFGLATLILLLPWVIYLSAMFGLELVIKVFSNFAISSASIIYQHNVAPFFWYIRWWWESLRPGWTLFLCLFLYDLLHRKIDWRKGALLSYIFGGLLAFSIPINKIWWYVLPLIPAIAIYIYFSIEQILKISPNKIVNFSLIIILASLPVFLRTTNSISLVYGLSLTLLCSIILLINISLPKSMQKVLLIISLLSSLTFFGFRFPEITPYHWNTKEVATYYKSLPGKKCLWVHDMPTEAVIFYSNDGEVEVLPKTLDNRPYCKHYFITPASEMPLEYQNGKIIYEQGNIKLIEL